MSTNLSFTIARNTYLTNTFVTHSIKQNVVPCWALSGSFFTLDPSVFTGDGAGDITNNGVDDLSVQAV